MCSQVRRAWDVESGKSGKEGLGFGVRWGGLGISVFIIIIAKTVFDSWTLTSCHPLHCQGDQERLQSVRRPLINANDTQIRRALFIHNRTLARIGSQNEHFLDRVLHNARCASIEGGMCSDSV